jgi:hypothetical protein
MRKLTALAVAGMLTLGLAGLAADGLVAQEDQKKKDPVKESIGLFMQVSKVLLHPRCVNCHPRGDVPLQGEDMRPHEPPVVRGADGFGAPGMRCTTCHQSQNVDFAQIPGNPKWHLAPIEMAWEGQSVGAICRQIKDPERNGGMSMEELIEHNAKDELVAYGWNPGEGRTPVPGTQKEFGELFAKWVESGAHCPD